MGLQPLAVAGAAAVLLVAVLGADATMNRTYYVDVWNGTGWQTIHEEPFAYETYGRPYPVGATIEANASDEVRFRLRIDNGYPWSSAETYTAYAGSTEVARGTLDLPPRGEIAAEFAVRADAIFGGPFREPYAAKDPAGLVQAGMEVRVDDETLYVSLTIREVAR